MSTWQPIETAPKDKYILATSGDDIENYFIVKWRAFPPGSYMEGSWKIKKPSGRDPTVNLVATHWALLPEPPETK